jgi:hypothetical protein
MEPPEGSSRPSEKPWLSVGSKEEVDAAWDAGIASRIRQIDSGEVACVPWEVVMAEMRAMLASEWPATRQTRQTKPPS